MLHLIFFSLKQNYKIQLPAEVEKALDPVRTTVMQLVQGLFDQANSAAVALRQFVDLRDVSNIQIGYVMSPFVL